MPSDRASAPSQYHGKKSLVVMYFMMALVFGALAIASFLNPRMNNPVAVLPAVIGLWLGIWMSTTPIVRVAKDHVTWKGAPLAPRRNVLFAEISGVEKASPKKVFVLADIGGKSERYRLPLQFLTPEDGAALVRLLEERAKGA